MLCHDGDCPVGTNTGVWSPQWGVRARRRGGRIGCCSLARSDPPGASWTHARLKITPAQEDLWNNATQVMRENAKTMDALRRARSEKAQTMTAVEDFKSYGEISEAHADGIKKFVLVFSALYDSMSDAQKKNADTIFRRGPAHKGSR